MEFKSIDPQAFEKKIKKYLENGHTLETMKQSLINEKNDFAWNVLRSQCQVQRFEEQIEYLNCKILSEEN